MSVLNKRWVVGKKPPRKAHVDLEGFSPILRWVLWSRGIRSAEAARKFLKPSLEDMSDPFEFRDMEKAVKRVFEAVREGEKVLIFGDYDADGVTGTALVKLVFDRFKIDAEFHVPHRKEEGYGLNRKAIEKAARNRVGLIVTVDCGSRNQEEIEFAGKKGIDVIVTDHHEMIEGEPRAFAFLNPKNEADEYSFADLSGVGVAYKLAAAMFEKAGKAGEAEKYLDLAAIGTVADVMPMRGENRVIVKFGLERLREETRAGILALLEQARFQPHQVDARGLGFVIGPRLNAAGRMDDARQAVELLIAKDYKEAAGPAGAIEKLNQARQRDTEKIFLEVKRRVRAEARVVKAGAGAKKGKARGRVEESRVIFGYDEGWSQGIVGLVASKLVEEFGRPAFVLEKGERESKGSARSVPGFDLAWVISECEDLLVKSGGHEMAAGFTIATEKIEVFRERVSELAARKVRTDEKQELAIEAGLPATDLNIELYRELCGLEPFGERNERPKFVVRGMTVDRVQVVGNGSKHLRLVLRKGGRSFKAIGFRKGDWAKELKVGQRIDLVFELDMDDWMGAEAVQLLIVDFAGAEGKGARGKRGAEKAELSERVGKKAEAKAAVAEKKAAQGSFGI